MFHLQFIVEDKHLAKVMQALDGMALNLQVAPVKNAVKLGKRVGARHPGGGLAERVTALLHERKITTATAPELRQFAIDAGASNQHSYNIMHLLKKARAITGNAKSGFKVVPLKVESPKAATKAATKEATT